MLAAFKHSFANGCGVNNLHNPALYVSVHEHAMKLLQGIAGHGYYDNCTVPIIENTARECELTDRLRQAIKDYPKSQAVLVRRHGVYVWGSTWIQAKTQAECYDYLFEAALKMRAIGIDASQPSAAGPASVQNGTLQNGHAQGTQEATYKLKFDLVIGMLSISL